MSEDRSESTPPTYANVVFMEVGPFDVTMDFGYQSPEDRRLAAESGEPPSYAVVARIAMSHAHAKSMIPLLAKLIANLESHAGTVPTPGFEQNAKE